MNCKQGDLAMFTTRGAENTNRMVQVLARAPDDSIYQWAASGPWWIVVALQHIEAFRGGKEITKTWSPGEHLPAPDSALRPIRPGEGEDETITWAGLPRELEKVSCPAPAL